MSLAGIVYEEAWTVSRVRSCLFHTSLLSALVSATIVAAPVPVAIESDLVREHFAGPASNAKCSSTLPPKNFGQVLAKRWRELNPGFARVMLHRDRIKDANPIERLK